MQNEDEIWQSFTSFQSTSAAQKFLKKNYERLELPEADKKSYDNSYAFIYYIEHGKKYYHLASLAPAEVKPVLLFYGMIQLIKACILTVDPEYPATTAVLAHGVTTRKRKKRDYSFLLDEVKLQNHGLLSHFAAHLFDVNQFPFERINMETLFARIPEMNGTFAEIKKWKPLLEVQVEMNSLTISPSLLDELKMTERRFRDFFLNKTSLTVSSFEMKKDEFTLQFHGSFPFFYCRPFLFHQNGQAFLPKRRELYFSLDEVIVHYLLLYNLSMICRYETEWWYELFYTFASDDLPFIHQFLHTTATKIPYLLSLYLKKRRN